MNTERLQTLKDYPHLYSFLPMLYIAWSDEVLLPSEVEAIQKVMTQEKWLEPSEIRIINRWLDPANPPSARELQFWRQKMIEAGRELPSEARQSLAALGVEIAKLKANEHLDWFARQETNNALCAIEEALGVVGSDACGEVLADKRPEADTVEEEVSFPVEEMTKLLDGDYAAEKWKVRRLLSDPAFAYQDFENKDAYREQVLQWCKVLADQGLGAAAFPEKYGGKDNLGIYVAVFETLGYHDLSLLIKFGVQFGLFGGSIAWLGTEKHHKKYLKDIGTLALPGCFAMTESGHGSNVREIETTAIYDPETEEFIICTPSDNARKEYIGNAAKHGQVATVFAQLSTLGESYGVHAFAVRIRDKEGNPMPGVRIADNGRKLGLNGVDNGRLWFDMVRIPRENLLNRFGDVDKEGNYSSPIPGEAKRFFTMLGTLVGGRVCVPMAGLSAAKSGLSIAIKYALKRRQFGPPDQAETLILDYPTHQRRLMPLLANAYALDFAHKYMAKRFLNQAEEDSREIEALAAGLKAVSTWYTTATLQECREACGGNGYLWENRFADLKADTDVFTTFEGDNTVLLQLVAKGRLNVFKNEFRNMNALGYLRFFADQAGKTIHTYNPFFTGNTEKSHLLSANFHLESFQFREETLVLSVANRLKKKIDRGDDSYQAFLACQTHLVEMATAYIDRVILEQFQAAIEAEKDSALVPILKQLCQLYALHHLEKHKGWYLEQGYFDGVKTKAIRKLVDQLCKSTRQNAGALVDAFAIPSQCLNAAILQ